MPTATLLSEQALFDRVIKAERPMVRAAMNAIAAARDSPGTLRQLSRLISDGRIEDAVNAAARAGAINVSNGSAAVYVESGVATSAHLSTVLSVDASFDQVHDLAVTHIRQNRLDLVREWTDAQRGVARQSLTEGVEQGWNPIRQARDFRSSTGLTAHQDRAVRNYRRLLARTSVGDSAALRRELRDRRFDRTVARAVRNREPLSEAQINRMTARYRERMILRRSQTIARTEALRSVHAGNHDAFRQAVEGGHIRANEIRRTWVTARDERVRDTHVLAGGQTVGLEEPFVVGAGMLLYPGDPSGPAAETVNCRCAITVRLAT